MYTVCMRARCPGVHLRVVIIVPSESEQLVAGVSIKTLGADPRAGMGWAGLAGGGSMSGLYPGVS